MTATDSEPKPETAAPPGQSRRRETLSRLAALALERRELSIAVVAVALYVYFLYTVADFASPDNLETLGTFIAATAIIAAGEVFLMISGEIDLSVGQVYALGAFQVAWYVDGGVPLGLSLVLALVGCAIVGLVNGVVTTVIGVSSFIQTLRM